MTDAHVYKYDCKRVYGRWVAIWVGGSYATVHNVHTLSSFYIGTNCTFKMVLVL